VINNRECVNQSLKQTVEILDNIVEVEKPVEDILKMTKRSIYCSVPEKTIGSLHYLVIEYSAVDPVEFLRSILLQYKFGILLIGSDGPNPLIPEQSQLLVQGMQMRESPL